MCEVIPADVAKRRALLCARRERKPEDDHQRGDDLGQEARARHRQLPGRQIATEGEHQGAERREGDAGHMIRTEVHVVPLPREAWGGVRGGGSTGSAIAWRIMAMTPSILFITSLFQKRST